MNFASLLHTHDHNEGIGALLHHLMEALGLNEQWTEFFQHMLVDCCEVMLLLLLVMTAVFFLQSYIDFDRLKQRLLKLNSVWGYALAVLLGMLSPFCSCSMIPLMMGLLTMGVPLSVCLCMLTSASLLNLTVLMGISSLMGSFFFWYLGASLLLIGGSSLVMSRVSFDPSQLRIQESPTCCDDDHHHHHEEEGCCSHDHVAGHSSSMKLSLRLQKAFGNAWSVFASAWLFIVLGVGLSAALNSFFDMESIAQFADSNSLLSVTLAALVGFPIHSDLFSAFPVLRLLLEISPKTALIFSLSTMSISIPGIVLLSRFLRPKTVALYAGSLLLLTLGLGWVLVLL